MATRRPRLSQPTPHAPALRALYRSGSRAESAYAGPRGHDGRNAPLRQLDAKNVGAIGPDAAVEGLPPRFELG